MRLLRRLKPKFLSYNFGSTFWTTIVSELFERGAWYGFFAVAPLFLTGSTSEGALGLSHVEKGIILGITPAFLYLVPLVAGVIGDKLGFRKVLLASFAMMSIGYFMLSFTTGFWSFLFLFMFVGLGAGTFKPMVTATVTQVTRGDDMKTSVGFGLFYMIVNLGGFIGPVIGAMLRPTIGDGGEILGGSWNYVFYASSFYMVLMFVWTYFKYEEPTDQEKTSSVSLKQKLREMITDLKEDKRLTVLIIILFGYWGSFTQFFYVMPSWITEWVDTSWFVQFFGLDESSSFVTGGNLKAEMIVNLNALVNVFLAVYISAKIAKKNLLKVINSGTLVLSIAMFVFVLSSQYSIGVFALPILLLTIGIFTIGELLSSPRVNELMGRIAPEGKVGVYQGYGFLSSAGGFLLGGWLSGFYSLADKTQMYRQELANRMGTDVSEFQEFSLGKLGGMLKDRGIGLTQLDQQLWDAHDPYVIWIIYGGIGIATVLLLALYRRYVPSLQEVK